VAHPERVKRSLEQEQDALRHQARSTAWPWLADRPARRRRLLHRYGVRLVAAREGSEWPPAVGSLPITMYKSDWQISGKWRLEAFLPVTGRVLDLA
jgi:hypothetical protein